MRTFNKQLRMNVGSFVDDDLAVLISTSIARETLDTHHPRTTFLPLIKHQTTKSCQTIIALFDSK